MPFLDDFARSFTAAMNATPTGSESRRIKAETAQAETATRIAEEEERRLQETYEYQRTQRPAAEKAVAATTAEQEANAKYLAEKAAEQAWINSPEGRKAAADKLASDISLQGAQTEAQRAAARQSAASAAIDEWKMSDEGKQQIQEAHDAAVAKTHAEAEGLSATAAQQRAETGVYRLGVGSRAQISGLNFWRNWFPDATLEDIQTLAETGELPTQTRAIPEGVEPEGAGGTRPMPSTTLPPVSSTYRPGSPRPDYTEQAPPPAPSRAVPPPAGARGPTAGPSVRPGAIPYTAGTRAEAPLTRPTPQEMQRRPVPQEAPPARTPSYRAPTPEEPLDNTYTYRPEAQDVPSTTPRPMYDPGGALPIGYRPGEGRVVEAQSGTRRLPLNDRTRTMLEQASAATGLDVRVTSGAQPSSGPNRVGGHRHDEEVGAGDIQLIDRETGKPVSMETEEGQQRIVEFMRAARDAGATGFGAGLDYMGADTIHVGFGDPGVWGAGGKGANAPSWLVEGLGQGGGRPSGIPAGTPSRPAGVARAYQGLQQRDMPRMQAAVLAGNIQQESGGDPNALNEGEGAVGIIQWRMDRLEKLNAFAAENGGDPRSLDTQLDFLMAEGESLGTGQDKAAWQEFMSATTPEAANAALKKFIRYGDDSEGTRLEYAQNLLSGTGKEVRGEQLLSKQVGGGRGPTPRGEAGRRVQRTFLVNSGTTAAREGAKAALVNAGLGGPAPAVTDTGRTARLQGFVSGQGAASSQELANAQEIVQKVLPRDIKLSRAEMNLLTLGGAYDWFTNVEPDPDKAKGVAAEIYQAYKQKAGQYMAIAKTVAQSGDINKAVKIAEQAYAFVPDGQEASFSMDKDGNFLVTFKDIATGKPVAAEQLVTPDEMFSQIMKWSSVDFDSQIRRAAGAGSREFEQFTSPQEAIPAGQSGMPPGSAPVTMESIVYGAPEAVPMPAEPNLGAMEEKERGPALDIYKTRLSAAEKAREAITPKPFTPEQQEQIRQEMVNAKATMPDEVARLEELFKDRPMVLMGVLSKLRPMNPDVPMEMIVSDLAQMAVVDPQNPERPNFNIVGQTDQTISTQVAGSPVVLTMQPNTYFSIQNALAEAMGVAEQTRQGAIATQKERAARDARTAAERAAIPAARTPYGPPIPREMLPLSPRGRSQPSYTPEWTKRFKTEPRQPHPRSRGGTR